MSRFLQKAEMRYEWLSEELLNNFDAKLREWKANQTEKVKRGEATQVVAAEPTAA